MTNIKSKSYWVNLEQQDKVNNMKAIRGSACIYFPIIGFILSFKFIKDDKKELYTCMLATILGIMIKIIF